MSATEHAANAQGFIDAAFHNAQERAKENGTRPGASIFTPQESLTLAGVYAVMALRADLIDNRRVDV